MAMISAFTGRSLNDWAEVTVKLACERFSTARLLRAAEEGSRKGLNREDREGFAKNAKKRIGYVLSAKCRVLRSYLTMDRDGKTSGTSGLKPRIF